MQNDLNDERASEIRIAARKVKSGHFRKKEMDDLVALLNARGGPYEIAFMDGGKILMHGVDEEVDWSPSLGTARAVERRAMRQMFPEGNVEAETTATPEQAQIDEQKAQSVCDFAHLGIARDTTSVLVGIAELMQADAADVRTREAAALFRLKLVAAWHDSRLRELFWESRHNTALVHFKPKERPSL